MKRLIIGGFIFTVFATLMASPFGRDEYGRTIAITDDILTWSERMVLSYESIHGLGNLGRNVKNELNDRFEDLENTFGNRSSADFILMFRFNNDVDSIAWTKTGDTLRWDYGDTVIVGNYLPAYTWSDESSGILTVTSTDGWGGLTKMDFSSQPFYEQFFDIGTWTPNLTTINISFTEFECVSDSIASGDSLRYIQFWYAYYVTGDVWKFMNCTKCINFNGRVSGVTGTLDSFYTMTDLAYIDMRLMGADITYSVETFKYWSPEISYINLRNDYGSGNFDSSGQCNNSTITTLVLHSGVQTGENAMKVHLENMHGMTGLIYFECHGSDSMNSDIAHMAYWTKLEQGNWGGSAFYGDIGDMIPYISDDQWNLEFDDLWGIEGDIACLNGKNNYSVYMYRRTMVYGDMINLTSPIAREYTFKGCSGGLTVSGYPGNSPEIDWWQVDSTGLEQAEVDTIIGGFWRLIERGDYNWDNAPSTFTLNVQNNTAPSATALAWADQIDSAFTAHGKTLNFNCDE